MKNYQFLGSVFSVKRLLQKQKKAKRRAESNKCWKSFHQIDFVISLKRSKISKIYTFFKSKGMIFIGKMSIFASKFKDPLLNTHLLFNLFLSPTSKISKISEILDTRSQRRNISSYRLRINDGEKR